MALFTRPSGAARTAVLYITLGALIDVWSVIYWIYLSRHPEGHTDAAYYWVYGFFFSGLVLLVIGLALGRIGRSARHAELPPEVVTVPPDGVTTVAGPNGAAPYFPVAGQVVVPAQPGATTPAAFAAPPPAPAQPIR